MSTTTASAPPLCAAIWLRSVSRSHACACLCLHIRNEWTHVRHLVLCSSLFSLFAAREQALKVYLFALGGVTDLVDGRGTASEYELGTLIQLCARVGNSFFVVSQSAEFKSDEPALQEQRARVEQARVKYVELSIKLWKAACAKHSNFEHSKAAAGTGLLRLRSLCLWCIVCIHVPHICSRYFPCTMQGTASSTGLRPTTWRAAILSTLCKRTTSAAS